MHGPTYPSSPPILEAYRLRQLHNLPLGPARGSVHLEEVQEVLGGAVLQQGVQGRALGGGAQAPLQGSEAGLSYSC